MGVIFFNYLETYSHIAFPCKEAFFKHTLSQFTKTQFTLNRCRLMVNDGPGSKYLFRFQRFNVGFCSLPEDCNKILFIANFFNCNEICS